MMDKEQLLERYFENQLSEEEQRIFKNYLDTDASFAAEFTFQKKVQQAIALNEREALKKKLQSFETAKSNTNWISKWSVAASITLALVAGYWFMNQSPDNIELYNQYYQTYPNVIAPTVRGESKTDLKSKAFFAYDTRNYQKAYVLFSQLYATDKEDYALFYSSVSLIELDKHSEALLLLEKFNTATNNPFSPFVAWYKALTYLKLDDKEKAIELLQPLSEIQNPQQEQAQKLLEELD